MTIIEDTRQQAEKHEIKHEYFKEKDIKIIRSKLPIGDYARLDNMSVVIDTKKDIQELIIDVTKDHTRFRNEILRAQENGIKLIVLVENTEGVKAKTDLLDWYNWRLKKNPKATTGKMLFKIISTMEDKYGVKFLFCNEKESPVNIEYILNNVENYTEGNL